MPNIGTLQTESINQGYLQKVLIALQWSVALAAQKSVGQDQRRLLVRLTDSVASRVLHRWPCFVLKVKHFVIILKFNKDK